MEGNKIIVEGKIKESPRKGLVLQCTEQGGKENCHPFCKSSIAPKVREDGEVIEHGKCKGLYVKKGPHVGKHGILSCVISFIIRYLSIYLSIHLSIYLSVCLGEAH